MNAASVVACINEILPDSMSRHKIRPTECFLFHGTSVSVQRGQRYGNTKGAARGSGAREKNADPMETRWAGDGMGSM